MTTVAQGEIAAWLPEVLADFGLGAIRGVEVLSGGMFSKPLSITTDSGQCVLRGHRFRDTYETLRFQISVLDALHAQGIPCPRVLRSRSGQTGFLRDGVLWALYEYVPGTKYSWSEWQEHKRKPGFLERLGAGIARVHDALAAIEPEGDARFSPSHPPIQFDSIDRIREEWEENMEQLAHAPERRVRQSRGALLEHRAAIADTWRLLAEASGSLAGGALPKQLVHGDVSPVNLIFSADSVTLIDWDCLHYGLRVYDAMGDILNRPPSTEASRADFRAEEIDALFKGYDSAALRPLRDRERSRAGVLSLARQLEDLRQRMAVISQLSEAEDAQYAVLIHGRVRMLDQIAKHYHLTI